MTRSKSVPIVFTHDLPAVREFYTSKLGFLVTFDSPMYLGLRDAPDGGVELGFMVPEEGQSPFGGGLYLGLEVPDVDAVYEQLQARGVATDGPPTSNPWGDRSFVVLDPIGVPLRYYTSIAANPEYQQYFV